MNQTRPQPRSPDPVSGAAAYQRQLLEMLGDDDPAQAQAEAPQRMRDLLGEAGDALRQRPAPDEWSVIECVAHLVDSELVASGRYRWILAHDEPQLMPYDQDRWADRLRHLEDDPELLLATFEALRRANLELWRRTPPAERARIGQHLERGPESMELTFRLAAGHDRLHLAQAQRAFEAARAAAD